ncbi:MAG: GlxA family transcriptional regulator [Calditrichia bacterium]
MKHISILVPRGDAILETITGSLNMFRMANAYLRNTGQLQEDKYKIDLVGLTKEASCFNGAFQVTPTKSIDQVVKTDLIVISGISGDLEKALVRNSPFINWIKKQRIENGAKVASLCKGAFLLAETGLLNGKSCATHWTVHQAFIKRFPQVNLLAEKIITEDNGIYSSGGAYSFLNLLIYLVEKYYGRESAIWCAKVSEIDYERSDQSHFIIFNGQKDHSDEPIKEAQLYIEKNFQKKLSIEELANTFAISRRNFVRRFKKATYNTPLEYIQRVKVESAKRSLESSTLNVSDVMYSVGYNDDRAFRKTFKKFTGLSPLEYRRKYNREMALL